MRRLVPNGKAADEARRRLRLCYPAFLQGSNYFAGLEVGKLGRHALNGHFQFFANRRLGRERVGGNFLAIFHQGPEVAANRVLRHFPRFGNGPAIGHDSRQRRSNNLVPTLQEPFADNRVPVLGRNNLPAGLGMDSPHGLWSFLAYSSTMSALVREEGGAKVHAVENSYLIWL